ncbi:MAG: hypothetical protein AAGC95_05120 [Pseudomonadota bacterium]
MTKAMIVPKIRSKLAYRENVPRNISSLNRHSRRAFFSRIYRLVHCENIFSVKTKLDWHVSKPLGDGLRVYGAIIHQNFIAFLKIIDRKIHVESIVDKFRLLNSSRRSGCKILEDRVRSGGTIEQVTILVTPERRIAWMWRKLEVIGRRVLEWSGAFIEFTPQRCLGGTDAG